MANKLEDGVGKIGRGWGGKYIGGNIHILNVVCLDKDYSKKKDGGHVRPGSVTVAFCRTWSKAISRRHMRTKS